MNKSLKLWLCAVMIAAVVLMAVCSADYLSRGRQLRSVEALLSESRAAWEQISADKEELKKDLKSKKSELKEAELSLSEATERAVELKAEIETLKAEIEALKNASD